MRILTIAATLASLASASVPVGATSSEAPTQGRPPAARKPLSIAERVAYCAAFGLDASDVGGRIALARLVPALPGAPRSHILCLPERLHARIVPAGRMPASNATK